MFYLFKIIVYRKQYAEKFKMIRKWRRKKGVLILGYELYERLVRSENVENKEIIEALVDPGSLVVQYNMKSFSTFVDFRSRSYYM